MSDSITSESDGRLRQAFKLLAAAETGEWPTWDGPSDEVDLRARVELLTLMFDMLPRSDLEYLDHLIVSWTEEFQEHRLVSVDELRTNARNTVNRVRARRAADEKVQQHDQWAKFATKLQSILPGASLAQPAADAEFDPVEAERLCGIGLSKWVDQLENSPRWKQIAGVVPGEAPMDIDDVYVELFAIAAEDIEQSGDAGFDRSRRVSRQRRAAQCPVLSIAAMVARTLEKCVVTGEPGSGKSTLVQWLGRAAIHGKFPDFDLALVVKLGAFSEALAKKPTLSILEFFFQTLGKEVTDWRPAAHWLRRAADRRRRCLLLLDGWDEVPVAQRDAVLEQIHLEEAHFVTIITSRPSGLPRQLRDSDQVGFYHIAGLSPRASEQLVEKLLGSLGRLDLLGPLAARIAKEADFREMAASPFLLGLLVRVFVRKSGHGSMPHTLAEVYHHVTAWMQEQYNNSPGRGDPMTTDHLAGLRRLSYDLLFKGSLPRYLFRGQALSESIRSGSPEPVLRSRFVTRPDPAVDEYAFLHATLQEYFAATQATAFSADELDRFLDRAFQSASRLIVLEFLAGLGGQAGQQCERRAFEWFRTQDRFQQILLRVARLATAGRWPADDPQGFGSALRRELWRAIENGKEMALVKATVEAFAELDAVDLSRRALKAPRLDDWAINCIMDAVPLPVARQHGLDRLLKGPVGDFAGFDARGGATPEELEVIRARLTKPGTRHQDRRQAVVHAGAARDSGSVGPLLEILTDDALPIELRCQAIDSLGAIGGRVAVDALVATAIGDITLPEECTSMACAVLRHCGTSQRALDPVGRDRLLRRLAALPAEEPRLHFLLMALEGYPIREGGAVVAQVAQQAAVRGSTRAAAVLVLATVADRQLAQRVVATIESESVSVVVDTLLLLAIQRSLSVPLTWLAGKVMASRQALHQRQLLTGYLQVFPQASAYERDEGHRFLHRFATEALQDDSGAAAERSTVLLYALTQAKRQRGTLFDDMVLERARNVLARFAVAPEEVHDNRVVLAAAMVGYEQVAAARSELQMALDAVLSRDAGADVQSAERLAAALADNLAKIAPANLLWYPLDCEVVQRILGVRAAQLGWIVSDERIIDAEGLEFASVSGTSTRVSTSTPELSDLVRQLPAQSRRYLESYWEMVRERGLCQPSDSLQQIHSTMSDCLVGKMGEEWSESLEAWFPDGLPKFDTWRSALKRIARKFAGQPEMSAVLRRIGLSGRRPKKGR